LRPAPYAYCFIHDVAQGTYSGQNLGGVSRPAPSQQLEQEGYVNIPQKHDIPASLLNHSTAVKYIAGNLQYMSNSLETNYGNQFTSQNPDKQNRLILIGYNQGWETLKYNIDKFGFTGTVNRSNYDNLTLDDYYRWRGTRNLQVVR